LVSPGDGRRQPKGVGQARAEKERGTHASTMRPYVQTAQRAPPRVQSFLLGGIQQMYFRARVRTNRWWRATRHGHLWAGRGRSWELVCCCSCWRVAPAGRACCPAQVAREPAAGGRVFQAAVSRCCASLAARGGHLAGREQPSSLHGTGGSISMLAQLWAGARRDQWWESRTTVRVHDGLMGGSLRVRVCSEPPRLRLP